MSQLAVVVVTYKRQELLGELLDSVRALSEKPDLLVVVDNENSPETGRIVADAAADLPETKVQYAPQATNTGGAGGFSEGMRLAYEAGADWIWMMDDDVAVLPEGLARVRRWTDGVDRDLAAGVPLDRTHGVLQPQRRNFDGSAFYWQYHFVTAMGIPNPFAPRAFPEDGAPRWRPMNTACFEGGVFHREVVRRIGLPDARFFIYWDDTIYGYLSTKVTRPALVSDFALRRTRTLQHLPIGRIRKLNSTSDMARYHIMRNRGYMARYLQAHGDLRPALFALGTAVTFGKEFVRLFVSGHVRSGLPELVRGWRDARALRRDPRWEPPRPLGA